MSNSYVVPYGLMGATIGGTITYATNSPIFFVVGVSLGVCSGMIRDRNIKTQSNNTGSTMASTGLKIAGIYVLGTPILILACGLGIVLCFKR